MNTLIVKNVSYHGEVWGYTYEVLEHFSHEFHFGKSYLLNAEIGHGALALAWMIGGAVEQETGTIEVNGEAYSTASRRQDAWLVRTTEIKRFGMITQSVKAQVRQGLRKTGKPYSLSETEIMQRLSLSPERYTRTLRQFSSEGWRASCAIGLAHGKTIFCFPPFFYSYSDNGRYVADHRLWLDMLLDILKSVGALVLFLAPLTDATDGLCDEVINLS